MLPGIGDLRNYELLVQAGFTPEQTIQIMTLNGARILGEEEQRRLDRDGETCRSDDRAGNPLRMPAEIYDVVMVFKGGLGFDSARLREAARGKVGID